MYALFFLSKCIQEHPAVSSLVLCWHLPTQKEGKLQATTQWDGELQNGSSEGIIEGKLTLHDLE